MEPETNERIKDALLIIGTMILVYLGLQRLEQNMILNALVLLSMAFIVLIVPKGSTITLKHN